MIVPRTLSFAIKTGTLFAIASLASGCWMEPGEAAAPAAVSGPPPGLEMRQTFAEEFEGKAVDTKRWNRTYGPRNGDKAVGARSLWSNGELQIYFDPDYLGLGIDPFTFADGALTIVALPLPPRVKNAVFGDLARQPNLLPAGSSLPRIEYSSGAITTRDVFKQQYGYFEIRAKWSTGKGVWPAFWLLPATGAWPPEIDVIEAHGDKPGIAFQTIHSTVAPRNGQVAEVTGSQQEYHLYGVLWMPDRVDYYVDGKKTGTMVAPSDLNQPMYLLANLAIGGHWPGFPDPDPKFRATYTIDHIRVWQFTKKLAAPKK